MVVQSVARLPWPGAGAAQSPQPLRGDAAPPYHQQATRIRFFTFRSSRFQLGGRIGIEFAVACCRDTLMSQRPKRQAAEISRAASAGVDVMPDEQQAVRIDATPSAPVASPAAAAEAEEASPAKRRAVSTARRSGTGARRSLGGTASADGSDLATMTIPSLGESRKPVVQVGGVLAVYDLGRIDPRFHNEHYVYTIGYTSERRFHSHLELGKFALYRNEVVEVRGQVMFKVISLENGEEWVSSKPTGAINTLLQRVELMKRKSGNPEAKVRFSGPDWFGYYKPEVAKLIQSMPEIAQCDTYVPQDFSVKSSRIYDRQGRERPGTARVRSRVMGTTREVRQVRATDVEVAEPEPPPPPPELEGCARTEPFRVRTLGEKAETYVAACVPPLHVPPRRWRFEQAPGPHTVAGRGAPDEVKFRLHRAAIPERLTFGKSSIHGYGVFARIPIAANEILVEYTGELIRQVNTDVREARYRRVGKDCYMFRITGDCIIDATDCGNLARLINHSCNPNCYSRQVTADGAEHIVIESLRTIYPGEELTYDYQFPIEEEKVKCCCRSRNCRGTMN